MKPPVYWQDPEGFAKWKAENLPDSTEPEPKQHPRTFTEVNLLNAGQVLSEYLEVTLDTLSQLGHYPDLTENATRAITVWRSLTRAFARAKGGAQ